MPGGRMYHHASSVTAPASKASSSILPQEAFDGSPRPRNESVASDRITTGTVSVVLARISGETLGRMWRDIRCQFEPPSARLRST